MDRHSTAPATRVARPTSWKCVIPAILVLGAFQAAIAESTLQFTSNPGESSTSGTRVAAVPDAQFTAGISISAWQHEAAGGIRIIAPSQPGQVTSPRSGASDATGVPAPIVAGLEARSLRAASLIASESMPTDELELATALIAAGRDDVLAAPQRVEVPVDSPQADLMEELAPYVLANRTPAESQPLAVALAESGSGAASPDAVIAITPIGAESQDFAKLLADVPQAERLQAIEQPTLSDSPVLAAAPSASQAAQAETDVSAPAHVAATDSVADCTRKIVLAPLQPSHAGGVESASESADRVALQEAAPVRTLISRAEPVALADRLDPRLCAGAEPQKTVSEPVGCPYLPGQSGARYVCGVDCSDVTCCQTGQECCIPWSLFGPGEYVGPARPEHVSTYYLRVNDIVTLTFIRSPRAESYRIGYGDRLMIVWVRDKSDPEEWTQDREVWVQPDGTITLPLVGEVAVAGKTPAEASDEVVRRYSKFRREPQITVVPLQMNTATEEIIRAVTSVSGSNGQTQALRVTPEGTIQAPGIGSVYAQGLTLDELSHELRARYSAAFGPGLLVSPSLTERAISYAFVGGEVKVPGRYTLEGPTTVMQAVTLAGGWNNGGNLHQVVVFRRDENWCLKAIKIDVHAPLYGRDPCPTNDVWLRDNDLVIVPKSPVLCATDVIELYFTRGVYAVFPIGFVYDFTKHSTITPVP